MGEKKQEIVSEALKAEEKLRSRWYILDMDGELKPIDEFDFTGHDNLRKFAGYEVEKDRTVDREPPHATLMRSLELVDYEPASDPGNLRFYPKGRMIKGLLEEYVSARVQAYGGMEVETPIMYNIKHPTLSNYLNRFPARQYTIITPNKKVFLRFAACFGQFLMAHDATLSYKHLPLRMYELTKYSFRVEKSGELTGLRRLRAFTMPDCHAFCADIPQAKQEMQRRLKMARRVQNGMGLNVPEEFELAIRVVKSFWDENKDFVCGLVKEFGKPALIEIWDKQFFYFVLKYEWNFVDALDKCSCLTTDQIDIENGERYDLRFTDSDGKEKHPFILHLSPSGAIERVMYALLERAYMQQKEGKTPMLPLWLCPTQIRVVPVSEAFEEYAAKVLEELKKHNVRADLDDRDLRLPRKVLDAEKEWTPFVAVVGEREQKSGNLTVRDRRTGKQYEMSAEKLVSEIELETKGMPFRPLPVPERLSVRPRFMG